MVMPHSALQTGQYAKWRTGTWRPRRYLRDLSVNFGFKMAWDLEGLEPNDFFPVPASVVFAKRIGEIGGATPLVAKWNAGGASRDRMPIGAPVLLIIDTSAQGTSPYAGIL